MIQNLDEAFFRNNAKAVVKHQASNGYLISFYLYTCTVLGCAGGQVSLEANSRMITKSPAGSRNLDFKRDAINLAYQSSGCLTFITGCTASSTEKYVQFVACVSRKCQQNIIGICAASSLSLHQFKLDISIYPKS